MKKVKIIDFQSTNDFHEIINLSMAIICSTIFDKTEYKSGKSSNKNVKILYQSYKRENNLSSNIIFIPKPVYEHQSKLSFQIRILCGFFITLYEYFTTTSKQVLLYNYTNAFSLPIILLMNILLQKKLIFLMHGELELQYNKHIPFYKPTRWYRIFHNISFKYLLSHSSAYILVLGDSIKTNLCNLHPQIANHVLSICHPYIINNKLSPNKNKNSNNKPLTIGTIGLMNRAKGIEKLIELSNLLSEEIKKDKVEIMSIGKVTDIDINKYKQINWIGGYKSIPRNIFENYIESLDYILYLYPSTSYKLTASGAILDAIKLKKPIICLANDYFKYIMQNDIIGYMVNDIHEIAETVKQLIRTPQEKKDYTPQFQELSKKISISHNTDLLKKELLIHQII